MTEKTPSLALQRRNLLPRWPADWIINLLLAAGALTALLVGFDIRYGLIPGALAALTQKAVGHSLAWRRGGVEKAFVMESSAISFYIVAAILLLAAIIGEIGLLQVDAYWLFAIAILADTTVRSFRESRYV